MKAFSGIARDFKNTAFVWLKSHTIMAGIVYVLLIIGLSVINYGIYDFGNFIGILFIAFALALLDFLPVIGLFAPMAIWSVLAMLVDHNKTLGISIIVLCFIIMLVKQVLEPFVVGKTMGISPVEEVISAIAGYALFNAVGLVIGPIVYTVGKTTYLKVTNQPLIKTAQRTFFNKNTGDDVIDISDQVVDVDD